MTNIIAHRGASAQKPENTLAAFEEAIRLGAGGIELDVRRCRGENNLPVIHDSTLDRTTGFHGRVKRKNMDFLKTLDAGEGETIPTLEEALDHINHRCRVYIEVKCRQAARKVAHVVDRYIDEGWSYDDLIIICSYPDVLELARDVDPDIHTGLHLEVHDINKDDPEHDAVDFHLDSAIEDMQRAVEEYKPSIILPKITCVTPELVTAAHGLGIEVITWTIREEAQAQHALACNVDGIIADDPQAAWGWVNG